MGKVGLQELQEMGAKASRQAEVGVAMEMLYFPPVGFDAVCMSNTLDMSTVT